MKKGKIILRSIGYFLISMALIWVVLPVSADAGIYDQVVRLHVLADSDDAGAQEIKLKIRDELLEYAEGMLADCPDKSAAVEALIAHREALEARVNALLREWEIPYSAMVKLGMEDYDTREYDGFRLPAGRYFSVRVILGEGGGKNWWCVLFPPVCLSSSQASDSLVAAGVGEDSVKVFTVDSGAYRFRFRLLEFFGLWS